MLYFKLRSTLLYGGHVGIEIRGVPLAGGAVVGMRSCSYAQIGSAVPVAAVVTGMIAGAAEVGDLIVLKAALTEGCAHKGEHLRAEFICSGSEFALVTEGQQRGVILIRETVGGDMLNMSREDGFQV